MGTRSPGRVPAWVTGLTLAACGPFGPLVMSNSTFWISSRPLDPGERSAERPRQRPRRVGRRSRCGPLIRSGEKRDVGLPGGNVHLGQREAEQQQPQRQRQVRCERDQQQDQRLVVGSSVGGRVRDPAGPRTSCSGQVRGREALTSNGHTRSGGRATPAAADGPHEGASFAAQPCCTVWPAARRVFSRFGPPPPD